MEKTAIRPHGELSRKMNCRLHAIGRLLSAGSAILLVAGFFVARMYAPEPFIQRTLPGALQGKCETRWLAPYVLAMTYSIQNKPVTTVRWFNEAGQVTQEVSGSTVQTSTDYVSERKEKDTIIHGIDGSKPSERHFSTSFVLLPGRRRRIFMRVESSCGRLGRFLSIRSGMHISLTMAA